MNEEAKKKALQILEKRDVSRRMLLDKLTEKGIPAPDAEEVADWLCSLGVIDDARFAALVVRHYAGKGYGEMRIREELFRRGIDRELWDAALTEMPDTDDTVYLLFSRKMRGAAPTPEAMDRTRSYLLRRGYSREEIRSAAERYQSETEEIL